jgi:hypothetical protein
MKMGRWNINRGFKDLRVWQDAIELYVISIKVFSGFPFELKRTISNGGVPFSNFPIFLQID